MFHDISIKWVNNPLTINKMNVKKNEKFDCDNFAFNKYKTMKIDFGLKPITDSRFR